MVVLASVLLVINIFHTIALSCKMKSPRLSANRVVEITDSEFQRIRLEILYSVFAYVCQPKEMFSGDQCAYLAGFFKALSIIGDARCRRSARASGTTPGSGEQLLGKKLEPVRGKKFLICGIIKGDGAKTTTDSTPLSENREFHLASTPPRHPTAPRL